ncbi:MAG: DUF502 domain-containing protein [Gammaproteobacteria bacterium]|nr:DUF502 domain-containing protein [Gammaproteobacteria bacterium]
MKRVRRYLVAGLLVWVPAGITFLILKLVVDLMDRTLLLLPEHYRPEQLVGFRIPGLGILLTGLVVFATGMLAANLMGRRLLKVWDATLQRIPLVRSIYGGAKSFTEVVLGDGGQSFKQVVLIEYPRKGLYSLGFLTGTELAEVQARTSEEVVCVFVPTTPNPTSGFILMVPRKDVLFLDMDVEAAVKMVVSLGVVVPGWDAGKTASKAARAAELAPPGPAP